MERMREMRREGEKEGNEGRKRFGEMRREGGNKEEIE